MDVTLTAEVQKSHLKTIQKDVFVGRVVARQGRKYVWSKYSSITRLSDKEALEDALLLKLNLEEGRKK